MIDALIDFESYFDKDYTLKKMPTAQYLRDPRFKCLGAGVCIPGELPLTYLQPEQLPDFFDLLPWDRVQMTCHNAAFDAALLKQHYGKSPASIIDTQSEARYYVAQGMLPADQHVSLASLAHIVGMAKGDTEQAVTAGGDNLSSYGTNDVAIMLALREHYRKNFALPRLEADLIDLHVRMAAEPIFDLDTDLLQTIANEPVPEEVAFLRSKANFADVLRSLGVEPEMKQGKKGPDYAFAKTDAFMQRLLDDENDTVRELAEMRVNGASSIERTRAQRFLDMGAPMPVPLLYYGAHTGRASGNDMCNLQNLPARGGEPRLRRALKAPQGHKVLGIDSSQIEVRVLSWRAKDQPTLDAYARGEDVYVNLASKMYHKPREEVGEGTRERQVSKSARLACLSADTLVLTKMGWKHIINVSNSDKVWDGEKWVTTDGPVFRGNKLTKRYKGLRMTCDHRVLVSNAWRPWADLLENRLTFRQALGSASLPLSDGGTSCTSDATPAGLGVVIARYVDALAGGRDRFPAPTSKKVNLLGATLAPKSKCSEQKISGLTKYARTRMQGVGFQTDFRQPFLGATTQTMQRMSITAQEVYLYFRIGGNVLGNLLSTLSHLMVGTIQTLLWTELTTTAITSPEISGSAQSQPTTKTKENFWAPLQKFVNLRKKTDVYESVYDLLNCGNLNRFTVLSNDGPLIVHNCQFGQGTAGFKAYCARSGLHITQREAEAAVNGFRNTSPAVVAYWSKLENLIRANGELVLPSGRKLTYPDKGMGREGFYYLRHAIFSKGKTRTKTKIWGGFATENETQAIARDVVMEQTVRLAKRFKVALSAHDEAVLVVPEKDVEQASAYATECFSWLPDWAEGLVVKGKPKVGNNYAEVK